MGGDVRRDGETASGIEVVRQGLESTGRQRHGVRAEELVQGRLPGGRDGDDRRCGLRRVAELDRLGDLLAKALGADAGR
ncbi:hypothetical protein ACFT2C_02655 [Promicromonospora sp. NPDC057138]|uniref:hypothetical protein n=1 Tax=Promicromonospora sp. NPDC057138 TaxID=3346031 RepID=UPI0036322B9B